MPTSVIKDMGPCEIVWGYGESTAAYLGKTAGDVKLTMTTNVADIKEDQAGDAAVNAILTGSVIEFEAPLTRLSAAELAAILNTSVEADGTIKIENQVECDLYSLARQVVIKPVCNNVPSIDPADWILLYKAYPIAGLDLTWNNSTQRIFPVKFKVFVSQESGYTGEFGTIGMPSGSTEYGY